MRVGSIAAERSARLASVAKLRVEVFGADLPEMREAKSLPTVASQGPELYCWVVQPHIQARLGATGLLVPILAGAFGLHLADSLLQREPLACHVGFTQCRSHAAQLRHERGTRSFVYQAARVTGIFFKTSDGPGYQRIIVGHGSQLTLSAREFQHAV